jgi:hypothetical protein
MIFSGINIKKELIRRRSSPPDLIQEAYALLQEDAQKDEEILGRLKISTPGFIHISIDDAENLFSMDEIKQICIRYRLRFLDSTFFKSKYPYDAIVRIKAFEKKYGVKFTSFHLIAPSQAFNLENINKDPLLFARINNNTFYLLHQWGYDMKWTRKIISWPLQSLRTLLLSILFVCILFAFSIPSSVMHIFSFQSEMYLRIWLTIHTFIGLLGLSLWAGLSYDKTFSSLNWDSKYFN